MTECYAIAKKIKRDLNKEVKELKSLYHFKGTAEITVKASYDFYVSDKGYCGEPHDWHKVAFEAGKIKLSAPKGYGIATFNPECTCNPDLDELNHKQTKDLLPEIRERCDQLIAAEKSLLKNIQDLAKKKYGLDKEAAFDVAVIIITECKDFPGKFYD